MGKVKDYSIGLVILGDDGSAHAIEDFFTTEEKAHEYANENEVERYFIVPVYGQPDLDKAAFQEEQHEAVKAKKTAGKKSVKSNPPE